VSYPQSNSNDSVRAGQDFWRLNTTLISPGDIYESEQTSHAIALGPDSDVARVNVAYFDPSTPGTFMNIVAVSPGRLFNGIVTASPGDSYAPSGNPARALIWSEDFFDQNYRAHMVLNDVATEVSFVEFIRPVLDVIQYFSAQPSLPPTRNDKQWTFQELRLEQVPPPAGSVAYVFPYYGRKYASIEITNCSADTIHVAINGLTYVYTNDTEGQTIQHTETVLTETTDLIHATANEGSIIPSLSGLKRVVTAAGDGMFDAIVVMVQFDSSVPANLHNIPLKVIVSDSPR